jgi:hypothetical protein
MILAENVNMGLKEIKNDDPDFFMVCASDVILEPQYVEKLLSRFKSNPRLVIASGVIEGEFNISSAPRGAGRIHRMSWWNEYVKWYPCAYIWESYAIYKAQSLGYETRSFRDTKMWTLRPTASYKPFYGYAMRQLGYHPLYAFLRCLMAFLYRPETGASMLKTYLSRSQVYDEELARWLRYMQAKSMLSHILHPCKSLVGLKRRVRRRR